MVRQRLAVVLGGFVNGLGLVRSLGCLGYRVVVVTTQPYDVAHRSLHATAHHDIPGLEVHPDRLAELLLDYADQWSGALVLPTMDPALASLHRNRDRLESRYRLVVPPPSSVPFILHKPTMLDAARRVGMQLPACYGPAVRDAASDPALPYPVLVKPDAAGAFSPRFGRKLFISRDPDELCSHARLLSNHGLSGHLFEIVPGPDSRIYVHCVYVDRAGEPVAECAVRKIRQSPPSFGVARVAELVPVDPQLREQSIELLRHIGFRGMAAAEFKKDERDGSFRFLEVNGRSVAYNGLLRRAGLDVARLACADHGGGRARRIETRVWPGAWIHLHADLLRSVQGWGREGWTVRDLVGPYMRPREFAVWSARDPGPFVSQWQHSLRAALGAVTRAVGLRKAAQVTQGAGR